MTSPPTFPIPDTAVQAAALELCDAGDPACWKCREQASAALAAALATGEVRQERGWWKDGEVQRHWSFTIDGAYRNPDRVRSVVTFPDGSQWTSAWKEATE